MLGLSAKFCLSVINKHQFLLRCFVSFPYTGSRGPSKPRSTTYDYAYEDNVNH